MFIRTIDVINHPSMQYSLLNWQEGVGPDQLQLDKQVREDEPISPYPVLQLYVALPPIKLELTDTWPLLGLFSKGHVFPATKFQKNYI